MNIYVLDNNGNVQSEVLIFFFFFVGLLFSLLVGEVVMNSRL